MIFMFVSMQFCCFSLMLHRCSMFLRCFDDVLWIVIAFVSIFDDFDDFSDECLLALIGFASIFDHVDDLLMKCYGVPVILHQFSMTFDLDFNDFCWCSLILHRCSTILMTC